MIASRFDIIDKLGKTYYERENTASQQAALFHEVIISTPFRHFAMHAFIGMLAHILPIPVAYDPWITALSIVPAILGAGVALHVVARPVITISRLLIGGTLMGAGIGAMHYPGMAAMQMSAEKFFDQLEVSMTGFYGNA